MNAKDTIKAVKACKTAEELAKLTAAENKLEKPRGTVLAAIKEKEESFNAPEGDSNDSTDSSDSTDSKSSKPAKAAKKGEEDEEIARFKKLLPFNAHRSSVETGAKKFFGDKLEEVKMVDAAKGKMSITVKGKKKFEILVR